MFKQLKPGEVFGYLTIMNHVGSNKHGQAMYHCKCTCGKSQTVAGYKLRRGEAKSCGCQQAALRLATMERSKADIIAEDRASEYDVSETVAETTKGTDTING